MLHLYYERMKKFPLNFEEILLVKKFDIVKQLIISSSTALLMTFKNILIYTKKYFKCMFMYTLKNYSLLLTKIKQT